jgi:hypothetical protein
MPRGNPVWSGGSGATLAARIEILPEEARQQDWLSTGFGPQHLGLIEGRCRPALFLQPKPPVAAPNRDLGH